MTAKLSLIVILFSVLKVTVSQFGCNINEYLTQNVNPCNSCDIRGWCPQAGGLECDCFPGYLRNSFGFCVPPEACYLSYNIPFRQDAERPSPRCRGRAEEYKQCGSACPPTCENRNRICAEVCVSGCFCRAGYLRNRRNVCVRPSHCNKVLSSDPNGCGPNEEFNTCGSACPPSCDNLGTDGPCTQQCVIGCFCTGEYVRKDGKCVEKSECGTRPILPRSNYAPPPKAPPPKAPPAYGPPVKPYPPVPTVKPPTKVPPPPAYTPPPSPPPAYTPPPSPPPSYSPPPTDVKGCPDRNACNKNCKLAGFAVGFCIGQGFGKCNCLR